VLIESDKVLNIACSTCFGHHYAQHQELKSITQVVAACGIWCCKDEASNKICNKETICRT